MTALRVKNKSKKEMPYNSEGGCMVFLTVIQ